MNNHPRQREIITQKQSKHAGRDGMTTNVEDQCGDQGGNIGIHSDRGEPFMVHGAHRA